MNAISFEKTGTFNVVLNSYSGMTIPVASDVDRESAKSIVKRYLFHRRRDGFPIAKIGKGEWEIQSPEDAAMVSDYEGFLRVRPNYRPYRKILGKRVYLNAA